MAQTPLKNFTERIALFVKTNYYVIIPVTVFFILEIPFLDNSRQALVDEAFYSNPAYNLILGKNLTNTNFGYGGNGAIVYSLYLSAFFYLFGVTLFVARFSSLILGAASLLLLSTLLKRIGARRFTVFLALSFFIFSNNYLTIYKFARPEALTVTLCIIFLIVLQGYFKNGLRARYLLFLLLLTFLIMNSHPFGSLVLALGGILILFSVIRYRQWKKIMHPFLLAAVYFLSLLFVVYLTSISNNLTFGESLYAIMDRSSASSLFSQMIQKIEITIKYYLLTGRIITFLPLILMMALGLFFYKRDNNTFVVSLSGFITLIIAYLALSQSMFTNIYSYVFIFAALSTGLIVESLKRNKIISRLLSVFIIVVVLVNIIAFLMLTYRSYDPEIKSKAVRITSLIPNGSKTMTSGVLWFFAPERDFKAWDFYRKNPEPVSRGDFFVMTSGNSEIEEHLLLDSLLRINSHAIDTVITEESKMFGRIDLMRFSFKEK